MYRIAFTLLSFLLCLLLSACQTARIPVPEALATSEPLPVQGRQGWKIKEHLTFGPYEAYGIERSWTQGGGWEIFGIRGNRRQQRYSFMLRDAGADAWNVSCETFLRKKSSGGEGVEINFKNRSELTCDLVSAHNPGDVLRLDLAETKERPLAGRLAGGGQVLEVEGTDRLRKALPTGNTTGYTIRHADQPLAAVEVINDGAVWLAPGADAAEKKVLSATAAALLLLEDLRGSLPE